MKLPSPCLRPFPVPPAATMEYLCAVSIFGRTYRQVRRLAPRAMSPHLIGSGSIGLDLMGKGRARTGNIKGFPLSFSYRVVGLTLTLLSAIPACHAQQQVASLSPAETSSPIASASSTVLSLPDAPSYTVAVLNQQTAQQTQTSSSSQQNTPQDQQPQSDTDRKTEADRDIKKQEQQRMLGIVPAFNEVIGGQAVPLTAGQKFHLFFRGSIDPYQFVIAGIDAGIEQAQDSYPEYHYGFEGYAKRYGASFADNWDGNFWGNAVLPTILHQDPRYFRLGHGSAWHRILYTASTAVRCKGDNGKWEPNYSNVLGNMIGGAISNVYYPASDRGAGLTIERGLTVTAEGIVGALAEEFYPDFDSWRQHRKARKAAAQAAGADAKSGTAPAPSTPANAGP